MTWNRTYSDERLADAINDSTSWRGVLRELGLRATSSGAMRSVRQYAERLGLDYSHFKGAQSRTERSLRAAVGSAETCAEAESFFSVSDTDAVSSQRNHAARGARDGERLGAKQDDTDPQRAIPLPTLKRLRNAGSLLAAAWFTLCGYDVSWPLEPSRYDLLVSSGSEVRRVQVKTTTARAGSTWKVYLSTCPRGRRTYHPHEVDDFFVIDGDLNYYLVPLAAVAGLQAIHLSAYLRHRVSKDLCDATAMQTTHRADEETATVAGGRYTP